MDRKTYAKEPLALTERARDAMLEATDTAHAPWNVIRSNVKKRARLNCIAHILKQIPYKRNKRPKGKLSKRTMKHAYDDESPMAKRRWVSERH